MKAFTLASALIIGSWPTMLAACITPTPKMLAWAKCAVAKLPSQGRTDIDHWFEGWSAYPPAKSLNGLEQNAQKWVPGLSRVCGSYSLLRRIEEYRLRKASGVSDPLELSLLLGKNELDLIGAYLALRQMEGVDEVKGCGS